MGDISLPMLSRCICTPLNIAVLPGDGIGPEVVNAAWQVWEKLAPTAPSVHLNWKEYAAGAEEYRRSGDPLTAGHDAGVPRDADAIFLGAMGLPDVRWPDGREMAPQLDLREQLELYAGVRPARLYHERHTPIKVYNTGDIDLILVRESTEACSPRGSCRAIVQLKWSAIHCVSRSEAPTAYVGQPSD